jgi:hypothetical protein
MKPRGKFQGMITIARFNWPLYLLAFVTLVASGAALFLVSGPLRITSAVAFGCGAYFIFVSLGVSHLVYDCSDLYRWSWLDRFIPGFPIRRTVFCHSGFDETSLELREKFPDAQWFILDHYDPQRMTEPSIHRARALFPPTTGTLACSYDAWPLSAESADVVFALLAIHEFRTESERTAWFAEAKRCLCKGGRVVLVEHVRDLANFLAFGPGFLHFHSCTSWRRCWETAGLRSVNQFSITPFIQVFVLTAQ